MNSIKALKSIFCNIISRNDLSYVVEEAEWAIKHIGEDITRGLTNIGLRSKVTLSYKGIFNSIVHFGSINVFMPSNDRLNLAHRSNKVVVTYFHVSPEDNRVEKLRDLKKYVDFWHTPSHITREKLVHYGVPEDNIAVIPLGIDISRFKPVSLAEKIKAREVLGIPNDKIVIGSFQKDGVGWGSGLEPKLVKGPDIFCAAVERIAKSHPVFVLLVGPSRGYVKNRLEKAGIPYKHCQFIDYSQIHKFYNLLDMYLVTSRVEGGPRAILECMASCVPFVSTRVGLVPEVVTDRKDGLVCNIEDTAEIVKKAQSLIEERKFSQDLCVNMRVTAGNYSWEKIAGRYKKEIYSRLKPL